MIATAFECFEIRAKAFEKKYGFLAPGKDSYRGVSDTDIKLWVDFKHIEPCLCGKEIPDNWDEEA